MINVFRFLQQIYAQSFVGLRPIILNLSFMVNCPHHENVNRMNSDYRQQKKKHEEPFVFLNLFL